MSDIMTALHQDHIHFSRLLSLLREDLEQLHAEERPDYQMMLDMVDYLANYADLYHHPKEDILYQFHLSRSSQAQEPIIELMEQHQELKRMTTRLHDAIEGLLHDAVLSKAQLMAQLREFIERQTAHLNAEEATVFPLLEQGFSEHDWQHIEACLPIQSDPLFGREAEQQYQALYERITETTA